MILCCPHLLDTIITEEYISFWSEFWPNRKNQCCLFSQGDVVPGHFSQRTTALIHPFFIYFYCFNFISFLPLLNTNKIHAIKKYSLEDMKKQTSWPFTLLAMIPLFSTLTFPSLKLAFRDSVLPTEELLKDTGAVPPRKLTDL